MQIPDQDQKLLPKIRLQIILSQPFQHPADTHTSAVKQHEFPHKGWVCPFDLFSSKDCLFFQILILSHIQKDCNNQKQGQQKPQLTFSADGVIYPFSPERFRQHIDFLLLLAFIRQIQLLSDLPILLFLFAEIGRVNRYGDGKLFFIIPIGKKGRQLCLFGFCKLHIQNGSVTVRQAVIGACPVDLEGIVLHLC